MAGVIAGVVRLALTTYVSIRIAPSTLLSSCAFISPAHSCSPPVDLWHILGMLLPTVMGVLVAGAVVVLIGGDWPRRERPRNRGALVRASAAGTVTR